jgi:coenzyme F420-0:L-glutamate ligase/coenzyme F420-1:gamma-L-glutamate ligase
VSLEVRPLEGLPEVRPGDDLAALLLPALRTARPVDGDVVVVTSKIVSKAEGRLMPGTDRAGAVTRETRRVVARRGDLVIAETAHGFVCANAGVDASNVEAGTLVLLPEDPDASARALVEAIAAQLGVRVGVVVTDTFGRPWRTGLVDVAIGCAGMPAVLDLRGTPDHHGTPLEVTVVALADQVAAAAGLVMTKAARVPAALVRGARTGGAPGSAAELVRPPAEDLFRTAPLQAVHDLASAAFSGGPVEPAAIQEALEAAHVTSSAVRFDVVPGPDPVTIACSVPDDRDRGALLGAGAAIEALRVALLARGVGSALLAGDLLAGLPELPEPGTTVVAAVGCGPLRTLSRR